MRVPLIGASGCFGAAIPDALRERHEVVTASRSSGDVNVDLRDPDSIAAMYEEAGRVDAVASTYVRSIEGPQTGQIYELGN